MASIDLLLLLSSILSFGLPAITNHFNQSSGFMQTLLFLVNWPLFSLKNPWRIFFYADTLDLSHCHVRSDVLCLPHSSRHSWKMVCCVPSLDGTNDQYHQQSPQKYFACQFGLYHLQRPQIPWIPIQQGRVVARKIPIFLSSTKITDFLNIFLMPFKFQSYFFPKPDTVFQLKKWKTFLKIRQRKRK